MELPRVCGSGEEIALEIKKPRRNLGRGDFYGSVRGSCWFLNSSFALYILRSAISTTSRKDFLSLRLMVP